MQVYTVLKQNKTYRTLLGATFELRNLNNGRNFIVPEAFATGLNPGLEVSNCLLTAPGVIRRDHRHPSAASYMRGMLTVMRAFLGFSYVQKEVDGRTEFEASYMLMQEQPDRMYQPVDGNDLFWIPDVEIVSARLIGQGQELMKGLYILGKEAYVELTVASNKAESGQDESQETFIVAAHEARHEIRMQCVNRSAPKPIW